MSAVESIVTRLEKERDAKVAAISKTYDAAIAKVQECDPSAPKQRKATKKTAARVKAKAKTKAKIEKAMKEEGVPATKAVKAVNAKANSGDEEEGQEEKKARLTATVLTALTERGPATPTILLEYAQQALGAKFSRATMTNYLKVLVDDRVAEVRGHGVYGLLGEED